MHLCDCARARWPTGVAAQPDHGDMTTANAESGQIRPANKLGRGRLQHMAFFVAMGAQPIGLLRSTSNSGGAACAGCHAFQGDVAPRGTGRMPRHLRQRRPNDRLHQIRCSCSGNYVMYVYDQGGFLVPTFVGSRFCSGKGGSECERPLQPHRNPPTLSAARRLHGGSPGHLGQPGG